MAAAEHRALARDRLLSARPWAQSRAAARLTHHHDWLAQRVAAGKPPGHVAESLGVGVMTRQERALRLTTPTTIWAEGEQVVAEHVEVVPSGVGSTNEAPKRRLQAPQVDGLGEVGVRPSAQTSLLVPTHRHGSVDDDGQGPPDGVGA